MVLTKTVIFTCISLTMNGHHHHGRSQPGGICQLLLSLKRIALLCAFINLPAVCFSQKDNFKLPIGPSRSITHIAADPTGRYIITSSHYDNKAYLWDLSKGSLVKDFDCLYVDSAIFSPDGNAFILSSSTATVLYKINNARKEHEFSNDHSAIVFSGFSPAGDYAYVTSSKDTLFEIYDLRREGYSQYRSFAAIKPQFSNDGKVMLLHGDSTTVHWFESASPKTGVSWPYSFREALLDQHGETMTAIYSRYIQRIDVKPASRHTKVIWTSDEEDSINYIITPRKRFILTPSYSGDTTLIFSVDKDTSPVYIPVPFSTVNAVNHFFNEADNFLVMTDSVSRIPVCWSLITGKKYDRITDLRVSANGKDSRLFMPDANYLIYLDRVADSIVVYDIVSGRMVQKFEFISPNIYAVDLKNNRIIVAPDWGEFTVFSLDDLSLVKAFVKPVMDQYGVSFSRPNSLKLRTDAGGMELDISSGKVSTIFTGNPFADFLDDQSMFYFDEDDGLEIYPDASKGSKDSVLSFPGARKFELAERSGRWFYISRDSFLTVYNKGFEQSFTLPGIHDAAFNSAFDRIIVAPVDQSPKVWNVETRELLFEVDTKGITAKKVMFIDSANRMLIFLADGKAALFNGRSGALEAYLESWVEGTAFHTVSRLGKYLIRYSWDDGVFSWDLKTGKLLSHVADNFLGIEGKSSFSNDDRLFVASNREGDLYLFDTETWKVVAATSAHKSYIRQVAFSPDGRYFVTSANDENIMFWNTATGAYLGRFAMMKGGDYLVVDSNSRFDATGNLLESLGYFCGLESIRVARFKQFSWEPGLLAKMTGVDISKIEARSIDSLDICGKSPKVTSTIETGDRLRFTAVTQSAGLGQAVLFVNDHEIKRYSPKQWQRKNGQYAELAILPSEFDQFLLPGRTNWIGLQVYDSSNLFPAEANLVSLRAAGSPSSPHLYVISIGISQYRDPSMNLQYAAKDARQIENLITNSAKRFLNSPEEENVNGYLLANDTTQKAIPPVRENIKEVFQSVSRIAKPEDIVVVFFAGHATYAANTKNLYFLTADAKSTEIGGLENNVAISDDVLFQWLQQIRAQKKVLILDACNSGSVIENYNSLGRTIDGDRLKALERLKDRAGMIILAAAAKSQPAYETSFVEQGLLTYAILESVKTGSGLHDGAMMEVTKLFQDAAGKAEQLSVEMGLRQTPRIFGNTMFDIGIADEKLREDLPVSKKIIFTRANFQSQDDLFDDYQFNDKMNTVLSALSKTPGSGIGFADVLPFYGSYNITGRYRVISKDSTTVSIVITKKGDKEQPVRFMTVSNHTNVERIVKYIVDKAIESIVDRQKNIQDRSK